jgi:hypothetical protein
MTEAVECGEAKPRELAYLTDRVLLAGGRPQEYGTQMQGTEEGWVPRNLRDPDNVDSRRAAVSLAPLREYIEQVNRGTGGDGQSPQEEKPAGNLASGRTAHRRPPPPDSHVAVPGNQDSVRGNGFSYFQRWRVGCKAE